MSTNILIISRLQIISLNKAFVTICVIQSRNLWHWGTSEMLKVIWASGCSSSYTPGRWCLVLFYKVSICHNPYWHVSMHLQNWDHMAMSHGRYLATPVKIISPLTENNKFRIIENFEFSCLCLQTLTIKIISRLDILSSFNIHISPIASCLFLAHFGMFAFLVVDFFFF